MGRMSKTTIREPKKIELNLSKKNIIIRTVITVIALVLAGILLTNSCSKFVNKSEYLTIDYPEFINKDGDKQKLFNGEISINYYYNLEKEKESKSSISNKIEDLLETHLVKSYQLLDINDGYVENGSDMHNLYYLNNNPNTWVSVNQELFDLLLKAQELSTNTNKRYSPFSGILNQTWSELFLSSKVNNGNTPSSDPAYSDNKARIIENIVSSINKDTTNLEFKEDNNQVRFNVLNEDLKNVKLDLGLLKHAYLVDILEKLLTSNGFDSGMITSSTGIAVSLGNDLEDGYSQINSVSYQTIYNDNSMIFDYSLLFNGKLKCMMLNPFLYILIR